MEVINVKEAREYVSANYPNDPLLKHVALNLLDQLPKVDAAPVAEIKFLYLKINSDDVLELTLQLGAERLVLHTDPVDMNRWTAERYVAAGAREDSNG